MCARKARRWSLGSWPNLICDLRPIISARLERVAGIEPARSAWEADRLPLHHTRAGASVRSRLRGRQRFGLYAAFDRFEPCLAKPLRQVLARGSAQVLVGGPDHDIRAVKPFL